MFAGGLIPLFHGKLKFFVHLFYKKFDQGFLARRGTSGAGGGVGVRFE